MKLSEKQKDVIRKMRGGEKVHYMDGVNAVCFFHMSVKNISWATIGKLYLPNLGKPLNYERL